MTGFIHCLRRAGPFCISPRTWLITVECDETGGGGGFRAETGCIRDWTPSTNPDAFSPQSPACASPLPAPAYNRTGSAGGGTHACSHLDFDLGSLRGRGGSGLGIGGTQGGICRQE